jgi:hypothetical protein
VYARIRGTAARAMTCPRADSSSKTGLGELEVNAKLKRDRSKSGVKSVVPVSKCSENINQKPSSRDQNNELFEANEKALSGRSGARQQREGSPSLRLRAAERHPRVR